jgi:hypothetical protein
LSRLERSIGVDPGFRIGTHRATLVDNPNGVNLGCEVGEVTPS